jgi:CHASE3 domain sensor protein
MYMEHDVRKSERRKETANWFIAGGIGVLILLSATFAFWSTRRTLEALRLVERTREVRLELERTLVSVVNVESAMRGFQLSGESALLEGSEPNEESARDAIRSLRKLTHDNPSQLERLERLAPLINEKFAFAHETLRCGVNRAPRRGSRSSGRSEASVS